MLNLRGLDDDKISYPDFFTYPVVMNNNFGQETI